MSQHGGKRSGAGRPKGAKAAHTLKAEAAKQKLIADYIANIVPINNALIKKAKAGDIQAIKELHDRVYGKATQPISGDPENPLTLQITGMTIKRDGDRVQK